MGRIRDVAVYLWTHRPVTRAVGATAAAVVTLAALPEMQPVVAVAAAAIPPEYAVYGPAAAAALSYLAGLASRPKPPAEGAQ
jgi:hypothetical protein